MGSPKSPNEDVHGLMHPASLVPGAGKDLIERFPEAECAVANGNFRGNLQFPLLDVDQQLAPALRALSLTVARNVSTSISTAWARRCRALARGILLIVDLVGLTKRDNLGSLIRGVSLSLRGSGGLDARLDTPPISFRHHPDSRIAHEGADLPRRRLADKLRSERPHPAHPNEAVPSARLCTKFLGNLDLLMAQICRVRPE
ncbi:hypothetical protein V1281_003243 [Nitrobacteraceae bacterium AZCC 2161]